MMIKGKSIIFQYNFIPWGDGPLSNISQHITWIPNNIELTVDWTGQHCLHVTYALHSASQFTGPGLPGRC